jgi:hypothetical protein
MLVICYINLVKLKTLLTSREARAALLVKWKNVNLNSTTSEHSVIVLLLIFLLFLLCARLKQEH